MKAKEDYLHHRFTLYTADMFKIGGGLAAILLQIADPIIAKGIAENSNFARNPMRRLKRTLMYVYAVHIGTEEQRKKMANMVNAAHKNVQGAYNPDQQLWVAATLYFAGKKVHEFMYGKLDPELDQYIYKRFGRLGFVLQLPEEYWPETTNEFDIYWNQKLNELSFTEQANTIAQQLLEAENASWWIKVLMPTAQEAVSEILPEQITAMFGLSTSSKKFHRLLPLMRFFSFLTPNFIKKIPAQRLLKQLDNMNHPAEEHIIYPNRVIA